MQKKVRLSVLIALLIGFGLLGSSANAQGFNRIVAFGDSLSDNGNIYAVTGGTIPKSPPYFIGHFSNGPTWVEQFATLEGIPLVDLAYGGATTSSTNVSSPLLPGIQAQINGYLASVGGTISDPNTLFTLWGGANDYLVGGQTNPTIPVTNLTNEINQLANAGARNILVVNLPDLGKLPGTSGNPVISAGLTSLTNLHNAGLFTSINQIRAARPNVKLSFLDTNVLFNQLLSNPGAYGFTNTTQGYISNGGGTTGVNPIVVGTGDPNNYVFIDEIHPTQKAHSYITTAAVRATAAPEAGSVWLMATGMGVLATMVARRRRGRGR